MNLYTKWHRDKLFPPSYFRFPCHVCSVFIYYRSRIIFIVAALLNKIDTLDLVIYMSSCVLMIARIPWRVKGTVNSFYARPFLASFNLLQCLRVLHAIAIAHHAMPLFVSGLSQCKRSDVSHLHLRAWEKCLASSLTAYDDRLVPNFRK